MINRQSVVVANAIRVDNSIVACSLLARFLRDHLSCEVVDSASAPLRRAKYDTLIMVNSPWGFCEEAHRARVRDLLWSARRVVWAQQDYNSGIGPRSFKSMGAWLDGADTRLEAEAGKIRGPQRRLDLWSILADYVERGWITKKILLSPRSTYVNWNALHYAPLTERSARVIKTGAAPRPSLFYFGAFRPDRAERFAAYLTPTRYPVTISTAVGRSVERFRELLGPDVAIEAREQNLVDRLAAEWATVYIEDERNLSLRHPPAARFYEALSARCCQLVDANAVTTLERSGFAVDAEWVVTGYADVARKLKHAQRFADDQQRAWAGSHIKRKFNSQLTEALSK